MNLQAYRPTTEAPWDLQRVWTLHRRTCFGSTWQELQRDLADGPQKSIDRILSGKSREVGTPSNFAEMRNVLGDSAVASGRPERLIAWWIYQIYLSPDPLRERIVLMWHNHFATSNAKVNDLKLMRQQNEIFRELGTGDFLTLLSAVIKHPSMLIWLDGDRNRRGRPNENLGRELLELFTLGVDNFTESDVKEVSRALTGWSVKDGRFQFRAEWHDPTSKTILGESGNFDGDDVMEIACANDQTSTRLAWRLAKEFISDKLIDEPLISSLARELRKNQLDIRATLETLLRSQTFFSSENLKCKLMTPESFIVGSIRSLELFSPPASTMVLADWLEQLGRKLFYPPNVGGWPGGRAWLNSRTSIARANFGAALVSGRLHRKSNPIEPLELAKRYDIPENWQSRVDFFLCLLTGSATKKQIADVQQRLELDGAGVGAPMLHDADSKLVATILASSNAHLS